MKKVNLLINIFFGILIVFLLSKRIPLLKDQFQKEGSLGAPFTVTTLDGNNFNTNEVSKNLIVVFWATWCTPCEVELSRLNQLIIDKKVSKDQILAISSFETTDLVEKAVRDRNYKMQIGLDLNGSISELYNVQGTPTVVFIDKNHTIQWMTTGLSPSLGIRAQNFLNQ